MRQSETWTALDLGIGLIDEIDFVSDGSALYASASKTTYGTCVFASGDVRHESVKRVAAAVGEGSVAISAVHDEIPIRETLLTLFDVWNADEVFITGTAAEVAPVVTLDGRQIGEGRPGPVTRRLTTAFRELVRSEGTPVDPAAAEQPLQANSDRGRGSST